MKHSHLYSAVGVGAAAVLCVGVSMQSASAAHGPVSALHHGIAAQHLTPAKKGNCYSNQRNDSGVGIVSQTFSDSGFDIYNSYGADNFAVKKTCKVAGVNATGVYFNGAGLADSETVTFYTDNGGQPGDVISSQTVTGTDNGTGSFTIPLSTVAIPPGNAWVSVSANMAFAAGGEWGWELSTHQKQGSDAMWENPEDGLGTGCTSWGDVNTCLGFGNDFMFTLTK